MDKNKKETTSWSQGKLLNDSTRVLYLKILLNIIDLYAFTDVNRSRMMISVKTTSVSDYSSEKKKTIHIQYDSNEAVRP